MKREIRRALTVKTAAEAIGPITPGLEVFGLSKGQFSLVDVILHCLETTGPADVVIGTWTAAGSDIEHAFRLLTSGAIRSLLFLVDFSFAARQPAYCAALRERFGDDAIRALKFHSKFITVRNETWNLVIRSSMNLNENRRLENFEISDDATLAEYLGDTVREVFAFQKPGEGFSKRPGELCRDFESFGGESAAGDVDEKAIDRKFFGEGKYDNDLRRSGVTFGKTGGKVS